MNSNYKQLGLAVLCAACALALPMRAGAEETKTLYKCVSAKGVVSIQAKTAAKADSTRQATAARQTPNQRTVVWKGGDACMLAAGRGARQGAQMRLNTSVPLVPPKPKLFLTAYSIFMSRAVLAQ